MIDAVAGAMVSPMPRANTHWRDEHRRVAAVHGERRPASPSATATTPSPVVMTARVPTQRTSRGVVLATTSSTTANGTLRSPAPSGS